ncbi:predicted protein [Sclerotinia sclerotiorum 1980 UF-70]|uniref:Uncharacterized protein n=1 Tax=Sclerotinia sclerotiorum (strain ATCC 18683 / 1980 / Ss-1) TaxID=665079 RepID=A7F7P2_SCLS1|nr:predicted protein [Sclerotinia sclerotiorum 1980 UF-70]EDN98763.1 predicted protein [Sclerotinia sclerotiorum 1980 UF-70]
MISPPIKRGNRGTQAIMVLFGVDWGVITPTEVLKCLETSKSKGLLRKQISWIHSREMSHHLILPINSFNSYSDGSSKV